MDEADWRKNLRYYRKRLGKTQSDLASQLNVKQQTIVGYEKGPTNPSIDDLLKITKYLGISISELFADTGFIEKTDASKANIHQPPARNYPLSEEPDSFSLNEPSSPAENTFYDHLKALSRIYQEEIGEIKVRLKALEDKMKQVAP